MANELLLAKSDAMDVLEKEMAVMKQRMEEECAAWSVKVDSLERVVEDSQLQQTQLKQEAQMYQDEVHLLQSSLEEALSSTQALSTAVSPSELSETSLLEAQLAEKCNQVNELSIRLASITDAFEKTRCYKPTASGTLSEADVKTIKDLQLLLQRSDAELIKRASKNAHLQHQVTLLTAQASAGSNDNTAQYTVLVEEAEKLNAELQTANSKIEKINKLNSNLLEKIKNYHDITSVLQEEMLAVHACSTAENAERVSMLETSLLEAEKEVERLKVIVSIQEGIIQDEVKL